LQDERKGEMSKGKSGGKKGTKVAPETTQNELMWGFRAGQEEELERMILNSKIDESRIINSRSIPWRLKKESVGEKQKRKKHEGRPEKCRIPLD